MKIKIFKYTYIVILIFCSILVISNLFYAGNYNKNKKDDNFDSNEYLSNNLKTSDNPGNFTLSSDDYQVYSGKTFNLSWTKSDGANNYSIYVSNESIINPNEATLVKDNITNLFYLTSNNNPGLHYYVAIAYNASGSTLSNNIQITIFSYPPALPPSVSDDDNKKEVSSQLEIPIFTLILFALLIILPIIIIAGYTINHYFQQKTNLKMSKKNTDRSPIISAKKIVNDLGQNQKLFQVIDENQLENNIDLLKDLELTSISTNFLNKIDKISWMEKKEKMQFIIEMLALTPKEREDIINYILKKSKNDLIH